jgi:vacuolar-type H+-ATPase subunit F/Vma7
MAGVAVVGERVRVQGFALAGALVLTADDPVAVRSAWAALGDDVAVVVLTPRAAEALAGEPLAAAGAPLTVVLPP